MDELERAVFSINSNSSPGLDGLTAEFYKTFWKEIKHDLYSGYAYSFTSQTLSFSHTVGVTTLIHKSSALPRNKLEHWRPITVTNVYYKIIAKVLANRLQTTLPQVISTNQSGFMKGRNIAQTIRQIDDVLQMAKIKGTSGYILALDFSMCFDRFSHDYVVYSLQKFGFGENFIKRIRILMSNGRSCINNGGWLTDFLDLEQGLRQGCPMSPLLYLVAAELLSLKIQQIPTIKGTNIPKSTDSYK
ncbi:Pol-like protein [Elysia marginata]|uniref:Pol-like protein n=1 Tax=Elysia marginata TaxID=1093978 RepID=A0AAV4H161_9GAST|nr:Pol-like protein [Elysia marginata]